MRPVTRVVWCGTYRRGVQAPWNLFWGGVAVMECRDFLPPLLVFGSDELQNTDQASQAQDVTFVRPVVHFRVVAEALESAVGEVYHSDVYVGWRLLGERIGASGAIYAVVDDEEGAGIESVGCLHFQDGDQSLQFAQDGFEQIRAQPNAVVQILVERLSEALNTESPAVVLVQAQVVSGVHLEDLQKEQKKGQHENKAMPPAAGIQTHKSIRIRRGQYSPSCSNIKT